MQRRWRSRLNVVLIGAALPLILSGCISTAQPGVIIHESKQGSVSLEPTQDHALRATHPLALDRRILEQMLRGVQVQEPESVFEHLLGSGPKRVRAISDDETAFLVPLLATALAQATSAQEVKFRVFQRAATETVTTGGILYAHGSFLYLTLTHYRAKPNAPDTIYMPNRQLPGSTGVTQPKVSFTPDPPLPIATTQQPVVMEQPDPSTLVINYKLLSTLLQKKADAMTSSQAGPEQRPATDERMNNVRTAESPVASAPKSTPLDPDELRRVKELVIKKDLEMEALKDEVRGLQQQLSEREAEVRSLQNELESLKKTTLHQQSQEKAP